MPYHCTDVFIHCVVYVSTLFLKNVHDFSVEYFSQKNLIYTILSKCVLQIFHLT